MFGNTALVKEDVREMRGWKSIERLWQDLHYAFRMLAATGFSLRLRCTLALGIGANTAIYSVLDAAFLRPLPFFEPDRLMKGIAGRTRHSWLATA